MRARNVKGVRISNFENRSRSSVRNDNNVDNNLDNAVDSDNDNKNKNKLSTGNQGTNVKVINVFPGTTTNINPSINPSNTNQQSQRQRLRNRQAQAQAQLQVGTLVVVIFLGGGGGFPLEGISPAALTRVGGRAAIKGIYEGSNSRFIKIRTLDKQGKRRSYLLNRSEIAGIRAIKK